MYSRRVWSAPPQLAHHRLCSQQPPPEGSFKNIIQIASPFLETLQRPLFTQKIKPQILPLYFEFLVICSTALFDHFSLHVLQPGILPKHPKLSRFGVSQAKLPQMSCTFTSLRSRATSFHRPSLTILFTSTAASQTLPPLPGCLFSLAIITVYNMLLIIKISHLNLKSPRASAINPPPSTKSDSWRALNKLLLNEWSPHSLPVSCWESQGSVGGGSWWESSHLHARCWVSCRTVSDAHTFLVSGDRRRHCGWVLQQFWISIQLSQKRLTRPHPMPRPAPGQMQGWKTEADSSKTEFRAPCPLLPLNELLLLEFLGILRRREVTMSKDRPYPSCHHSW